MSKKLLFITDAFDSLNHKKDTSIFMMEEASAHGFEIYQCEMESINIFQKDVYADCKFVDIEKSFSATSPYTFKLSDFSYVFMRKDPPVDTNYNNCLHLLSLAENNGARVYNNPRAIKEFNEKVFALYFSDYIPDTIITSDIEKVIDFQKKHKNIIVKPLDGMGGASIYKFDEIKEDQIEIVKKMTANSSLKIIAQEFLEDIYDGDFRILVIHGKPFEIALARIPQGGNFKGNLAAGGKGVAMQITNKQMEVASIVAKKLKDEGINFAGIDMIGDRLTEINITSPTCAREIFDQTGKNPIKEYIQGL